MDEVFGLWLKQRRKSLDLTQDDLAQKVGCSKETIRKIEAEERRPSRQIADRLAQHLGIPPHERAVFIQFARGDLCASQEQLSTHRNASAPWQKRHYSLSNFTQPPVPLIGRDQEVALVRSRLLSDEVRLLTLTGAPGVGKTRLGMQVVAELIDDFQDGIYFVPLAPIRDPNLVGLAIAEALRLQETADHYFWEILQGYLRDKQMLLLLDNFEHVVAAAPLLTDLLAACPRLKLLITSRATLRLSVEYEVMTPPLTLPDLSCLPPMRDLAQCPAVKLFVDRTQAVNANFSLTEANAFTVAEICVRLDGLPLAIELAAAWGKVFSPQALLVQLRNRLTMLSRGAQDRPARQRTLRDAIAWSYDLLEESEQILFRRLSIFVGCTLETAETLCRMTGDLQIPILAGIASLIDKSLLQQESGANDEPRFKMLETIHEYGLERLTEHGEVELLRRQHAEIFMALAEAAEPELHGPEQGIWLARLEAEHANLRAALSWSQLGMEGHEIGLRLVGALWWFWHRDRHVSEGRRWMARMLVLERGRETTPTLAKVLRGAGLLAWLQGDYSVARAQLVESLAIGNLLGDRRNSAYALIFLAMVTLFQGEPAVAQVQLAESHALLQEVGDRWGLAIALRNLGMVALFQGDMTTARDRYEESLALFKELKDQWGLAVVLNDLGEVARMQGDYGRAARLYRESLLIYEQLGDRWLMAMIRHNLGTIAEAHGDYTQAVAHYKESLVLWRELGNKRGIALCLAKLARANTIIGLPIRAAQLLGAAESLCAAIGTHMDPADSVDYRSYATALRTHLGATAFAEAWGLGQAMSFDQATAYALANDDELRSVAING